MAESSIEWTDVVWNPAVGCSRVSTGCLNCYAERVAHRGMSPQHKGLTRMSSKGPQWTGEVRFVEDKLGEPLTWRKPRRVFVNSMSDLFHHKLTNEQIAAVFGVMASCPQHTFQVLTKRPDRMCAWFKWMDSFECDPNEPAAATVCDIEARNHGADADVAGDTPWPLPNVWLGVSAENQATADKRVPLLLKTPAALRFVSAEPLLDQIGFRHMDAEQAGVAECYQVDALTGRHTDMGRPCAYLPRLDWVIVGGESGPRARPCDVTWVSAIVAQCREASVACFVKQLGAQPVIGPTGNFRTHPATGKRQIELARLPQQDGKGGDPAEWPADLRVRQFPEVRHG